ncbi:MAG: helix-turn-helix transcriptional regulator [Actinomycetota bacterium]
MLELAILGLLKERSMHGYQLKKSVSENLGAFWQVSYGSLYPALKRLQKEGAVEMVFPREDVRRRKNVYRLTALGEKIFNELAQSSRHDLNDENGFRIRLAFFRHLKPEARLGVLERRKAYLNERLQTLKSRLSSYAERVDNYTLSLMRHGMDTTEHDIAWLDGLIRQERRSVRSRRAQKTRGRTK